MVVCHQQTPCQRLGGTSSAGWDPLGIGELTIPWWAGKLALRRIKDGGFRLGKPSNIW